MRVSPVDGTLSPVQRHLMAKLQAEIRQSQRLERDWGLLDAKHDKTMAEIQELNDRGEDLERQLALQSERSEREKGLDDLGHEIWASHEAFLDCCIAVAAIGRNGR